MHGTKRLSDFVEKTVEKTRRAISPGRMSPDRVHESWDRDTTPYFIYMNGHVTRNDIYSLANPTGWLEDNTINFWAEYIEHEELSKFPKANIRIISTSTASLLKSGPPDQCKLMLNLPEYIENRITHIFVPVNDDSKEDHVYNGNTMARGNHWSLLVISLIDNVAFHYDSLRGYNHDQAKHLVAKIEDALPVPRKLRYVPMGVEDAPQQDDAWNCGIFVCIVMRHLLLKRLLRADANQKVTMSMRGQDVDYAGARKLILAVIDDRRNYALANNKVNDKGIPRLV